MLAPIKIDLSDLQEEFTLKQSQVEELGIMVLNNLVDRIFHNWQQEAMNGLHSTRKLYLQNLHIGQIDQFHKFIMLTGDFQNKIEEGFSAFDMKPGFLNSGKAKQGKNGRIYLTIPFRWATPDAIGESEIFANIMPQEIYATVRKLNSAQTQPFQNKVSSGKGLPNAQLPKELAIPQARLAFTDLRTQTTYPEYTHKGSIYEGIVRNEKTYENSTQGSYVSFRRVSEASDMYSWIHKGLEGKHFADKAIDKTDVNTIADRTIDAFLVNAGF